MKDKITIGILDQGVNKWWETEPFSPFSEYYESFEIECLDATGENNIVYGDHNYMVMDRLLEVCGNPNKVKIINIKVFPTKTQDAPLECVINGLDLAIENKVDLLNMSIGIPRQVKSFEADFIERLNLKLDQIVQYGGFTLIAGGNEGQIISNHQTIDNTNIFADNADNNLSVASHNISGSWDEFSSVGGAVDVSTIGSNLTLLGRRYVHSVSGTSFSTPSFTGVCANYLIDQFTNYTTGKKTAKEIIYGHLSEAIQPQPSKFLHLFTSYKKNAWYGFGSFESYVKFFVETYKRDVLRHALFGENLMMS